ncbi:MAG: hypothetical protein ABSA26_17295, partial [Thermoguttaceae bacterium]
PQVAHPASAIAELTNSKRLPAEAQPNHRMGMLLFFIYSPEGPNTPANRRQKILTLLVFLRLIWRVIKLKNYHA